MLFLAAAAYNNSLAGALCYQHSTTGMFHKLLVDSFLLQETVLGRAGCCQVFYVVKEV